MNLYFYLRKSNARSYHSEGRGRNFCISVYCLYLIYQINAFKTKKMNNLGWWKSYIAYMIATVTQGNEFIVAQT